ncbi:IclR-like transcriptional regulator [Halobacteriales archaeon QS_3_64_16]|nr:MAG: IclR-like transcriptional regulator [Halobacteriales archaeon QS_3_64_16]
MDRLELTAVCLICLLASVAALPAFAAGLPPRTTTESGISDLSLAGPGVLETDAGIEANATSSSEASALSGESSGAVLWQSDSFRSTLSLSPQEGVSEYRICAYALANGTRSAAGCERATIAGDSTESVNVTGLAWPANASTTGRLAFELQPAGAPNETLDNRTLPVTVLTKGGDSDGDGLTNEEELKLDLDPLDADMDADGLTDGTEIDDYSSSPTSADTDGDGVRDGEEVEVGSDPTEADSDDDGLADDTELTVGTNPTDPRSTERLAIGGAALLYAGLGVVVLRRRDDGDGDDAESPPLSSNVPRATLNDAVATDSDENGSVPGSRIPDLLTDEDRVLHLLDRHGGRMKQSRIVEGTEWSKAKVSRLLSSMDDEDAIEKLSLGRENVISLDREWIEASTSTASPSSTADDAEDEDTDADAETDAPEAGADRTGRTPAARSDP